MADPLYIDRDGHRTWLKWHRARRRPEDAAFTGARILEAMRLGASVEVDLVIHADHGCAILHNFDLGRETTGMGPVRATDADTLRRLHLRGNDGAPLPDRVMLLEDLCDLLIQHPPHPDGLLQLDFKEDYAALDPLTVENFAHSVGPLARHMIVSGGDANAIRALANSTPKLRSGYDPCYGESLNRLKASGDYHQFTQDALAAAPDAGMIYLHHQIVLDAERDGFDMIGAFHAGGRRVDAWTINSVTEQSLSQVRRLLALKADQITTDDPEGLYAALKIMTIDYDNILDHMVATAREAGALTLKHFKNFRDLEIGIKGPGDFVSDADRESELLIRKRLFEIDPDWSLTGEEFDPVDGSDPDHRWMIDPINGTTNFIYGQHYSITIALRRGNETLCGLVYDPVADEMFTARKGGGAFLNGERLQVSRSSDIAMMCVGTGLPTPNLSLHPGAYQRLDAIRAPIGAVRIVGSAANSCAWVACGRLTGYFEETGFVDTAAGILLVEEAGGVVTDWWGRGPDVYERTGCLIVANRATQAYLLEHLREVPRKEPRA